MSNCEEIKRPSLRLSRNILNLRDICPLPSIVSPTASPRPESSLPPEPMLFERHSSTNEVTVRRLKAVNISAMLSVLCQDEGKIAA